MNTTKKGLREGYTRATFIVNELLLNDIKRIAHYERVTIKDILNDLMRTKVRQYQNKDLADKPHYEVTDIIISMTNTDTFLMSGKVNGILIDVTINDAYLYYNYESKDDTKRKRTLKTCKDILITNYEYNQ